MAGLTTTGFTIKTLAEIKAEIEASERALLDANLDVSSTSVAGTLNGIISAKLREAWELIEDVYAAAYPDTATGTPLSYVSAITGTIRKAATKSTVTATVNLNAGVTLPAGNAANVAGNETMRYVTLASVTNSGGSAANFDVEMEASETGSDIRANAGTLTEIATPVVGWNSITNAADSVAGTDEETDAELRIRRVQELSRAGAGTLNAIRTDILDVEDVTSATVFENVSDLTDADGVPPKAIECVVLGGDAADIAEAIFLSKPAGIQAFGNDESETVTDSAGNSHTIEFSRPTEKPVYLTLDLTVDADYVGDTAVKEALKDLGDTLSLGDDVILMEFNASALGVAGVVDITATKAGFSPAPSGTVNLTIGSRELATFSTANITINS